MAARHPNAMTPAYGTDLAYIHHAGFSGFVRDAAPGLLKILRAHGIRGGLVIDLGCGGGSWARELSGRGYDVLGIDISPAMIRLARQTAPRARFVAGSVLKVALQTCHAVTALGEVLNYTFDRDDSRRELARFFRRVHEALRPGGIFVFDVAGPERERGRAPRRWIAGDDWAILLEVSRQGHLLTRRITTFRQIGKTYRRSQEVHRLRLYRPSEILTELRRANFAARSIRGYGGMEFDRGLTGFVAQRR